MGKGKLMEPGPFVYFEGNYVPVEDAKVSIMTHAFNYGTGLFEGIRGYYSADEDNILVFRLAEHVDRLVRNFNIMCMEIPETPEDIARICVEVIKRSGFREGVYIRPLCYKSELSLGPRLSGVESRFCCYVIKLGEYCDIESGLDVVVSSWRRLSDNAIPSRAKSTGSYINSSLAATEANQAGFDEAIFLREDGSVAEGSAMNMFMVLNGQLITTPPTADILVGITRNTVIELARNELGLDVVERPIARTELYVCDEVFFCGTGAQVAPVRSVDRRVIGGGTPGPVSRKLQDLYFRVVMGKVEKYRSWCTPVY
ncbi:MAG TPA: branched-chain amino acid transaminase [Candidatus Hydrogenedentes bacterium]|jgi:branched-chain amino acid aminotransferase|nr:branched-chain amino acid transaminase [Candidatus Hydrogenedentota bacterium]HOH33758.1 branched-chain amino acid transaminase [Candidatus Hydrogenedentota bacterium]HPA06575.1 branched-chain amino acid transaminase [Candidatus Hydrogenedentota bacterium]HQK75462.1 branched-chain amino acid transaminase [Candidatus Hydrogenedentota bacterium]HQM33615.1 branched-chain amino acid transaminase [Candidatus Hydrogenedentota bacterium]